MSENLIKMIFVATYEPLCAFDVALMTLRAKMHSALKPRTKSNVIDSAYCAKFICNNVIFQKNISTIVAHDVAHNGMGGGEHRQAKNKYDIESAQNPIKSKCAGILECKLKSSFKIFNRRYPHFHQSHENSNPVFIARCLEFLHIHPRKHV